MKPSELAKWLDIGASTLRKWTAGEFAEYFSPSARGGGRARSFSDTDAQVVALIAQRVGENTPRDQLHAELKRLQAGDWHDLPPMPPAPPGQGPISMVPREAAETIVTSERRNHVLEIQRLEERVEDLEARLTVEHGEKQAVQVELLAAREQLGELRGRLNERLPTRVVMQIVLAVAIGALVVVAAVIVIVVSQGG